LTGSVSWRWMPNAVTVWASVAYEIPKWTAFVTENNLRYTHAAASVEGRLPWLVSWSVFGDFGTITDGAADNDRMHAVLRLWRPFEVGRVVVAPRYALRYLSYSENLNDGYFDPQDYISNMAGAEVSGRLRGEALEWSIIAEVGIEDFSFDDENEAVCEILPAEADRQTCRTGAANPLGLAILQGESESGSQTVVSALGRLAWRATSALTLEAYAGYTDNAAQTAAGYKSRTAGVVGRYRF